MLGDRANPGSVPPSAAQPEPSALDRALSVLPTGDTLPAQDFNVRHRAVLWVLFLHVPLLFAFGVFGGQDTIFTKAVYDAYPFTQAAIEAGVIALFGAIAAWPRLSRRVRASSASLGLITASAVLVQFSGGYIEAHFHFFVVLALLALYEDWIPFLLGIGYVLVHHGTVGTIAPGTVYNHPAAITYPWRWAAVHAVLITGLCASLTTTWRMSEETRAERRRVLDAASDGILGFDLDGVVTFANPASLELLGARSDDIVGEPLDRVLHWAGSRQDQHPLDALEGIEHQATDARLNTHDGRVVPVEWISRPIIERGRVRGGVLTLQDVSEQKRIQEELRLQARRLKRNNQEWEEFGHAVSHDLKEPLRTVANYCQMVQRSYGDELDEEGREYLDYAVSGAKRMEELLEGLRTFSKVEVDHHGPFDDVDLNQVVEQTLQSLEMRISETDADVTVGRLPTVSGNASQLGQLFQNLVSNALKFHGSDPPRVRIWAEEQDASWQINVEDDGKGMPPDQADQAFRMFNRLDPGADEEGRGIGLAICKAVVNRHDGDIDVETELGEGTRFIIQLPKKTRHPVTGQPGVIASTAGD